MQKLDYRDLKRNKSEEGGYRPFVEEFNSKGETNQMVVKRTKSKLYHLNCRTFEHISNQKKEMQMMKFRVIRGERIIHVNYRPLLVIKIQ